MRHRMRWHRAWLIGWALAMGLSAPASALLIDDFSTGGFVLVAGSGGATASQACGAFCATGTREVFLRSGNAVLDASVQLFFSSGEAANVMPDGGGLLRFTYTAVPGTSLDLSVAGAGADLEVCFYAFELGATVRVALEDTSGASDTVSITPSPFIIPGPVDFALGSFATVDLEQIVRIEVSVDAPAA